MAEETKTEEIKLIKMNRAEPAHLGGPTEADVHPQEVENWKAHGWNVVEPPKPEGDQKPDGQGAKSKAKSEK